MHNVFISGLCATFDGQGYVISHRWFYDEYLGYFLFLIGLLQIPMWKLKAATPLFYDNRERIIALF